MIIVGALTPLMRAACDEVWKPVCGKVNGYQHTFTNLCWAKMEKAKGIHKGARKYK